MHILSLYQEAFPSCFEHTAQQDFGLVVHTVFGRGKTAGSRGNQQMVDKNEEEELVKLQCYCVNFLVGYPVGRFRWFKEVWIQNS